MSNNNNTKNSIKKNKYKLLSNCKSCKHTITNPWPRIKLSCDNNKHSDNNLTFYFLPNPLTNSVSQ